MDTNEGIGEAPAEPQTRVEIVAYDGTPILIDGLSAPAVIDLAGVEFAPTVLVRSRHGQPIGQVTASVEGGRIVANGILDEQSDILWKPMLEQCEGGLQASVGCNTRRVDRIEVEEVAVVNGSEVRGPAYIVRECLLHEVSLVPIGACSGTSVRIIEASQPRTLPTSAQVLRAMRAAAVQAIRAGEDGIVVAGAAIEAGMLAIDPDAGQAIEATSPAEQPAASTPAQEFLRAFRREASACVAAGVDPSVAADAAMEQALATLRPVQ